MPIKVTCSNCGGVLHAPDDAGGKRGRCPTCGNILPIPADRGASATLPEPAPKPAARSASFGDFATGPHVGPPPGPPPRASQPVPAEAPRPEPRKPAPKLPPREDPPRPNDPFVRRGATGSAVADGDPSPALVRGWKRARAGLGWVRAGTYFFLLPLVGFVGLFLYERFAGPIPTNDSGYLIKNLTSGQELIVLGGLVPALVGLLLCTFGRFGLSNAPKRSTASGLALLSALAALAVLGGCVAVLISPAVLVLSTDADSLKGPEFAADWKLLILGPNDIQGVISRFGLTTLVAALVVGQFWFASSVGRIGASLADRTTAARSTRVQMWLGLILAFAVVFAVVVPGWPFRSDVQVVGHQTGDIAQAAWTDYPQQYIDKLGEYKTAAVAGLILVVGLLAFVVHLRMTGAARRAIRGWLESHERVLPA